jgi:hypothetical protein
MSEKYYNHLKMELSLQSVWNTKSSDINRILSLYDIAIDQNSLVNKVRLAILYNKGRDFNKENTIIVSHPLFEKIALSLGRLEDIKAKIVIMINFEEIMNERNLGLIINSYNPVKRLYIISDSGLEIRNHETLNLEKLIPLDQYFIFSFLVYSKDKVYTIRDKEGSYDMIEIDLSTEETKVFKDVGIRYFYGKIGDLLYGYSLDIGLIIFNVITSAVKSYEKGGYIWIKDNIIIRPYKLGLRIYDGGFSKPLPSISFTVEGTTIKVDNDILIKYFDKELRFYNLYTSQLLFTTICLFEPKDVFSYDGLIYIVIIDSDHVLTIEIYSHQYGYWQYSGDLISELSEYNDYTVNDDTFIVAYRRARHDIVDRYDLGTNSVIASISSSFKDVYAPMVIA